MHEVHLVKGHVVYVYWVDTVYVQNNLPNDNFHNLKNAKNVITLHD